jgi:hypothetical protein
MGVAGQRHAPLLYSWKAPGAPRIGGWMDPRAGMDGYAKFRPHPPGFDPWTVQPVPSHYTDFAGRPVKYRKKNHTEQRLPALNNVF